MTLCGTYKHSRNDRVILILYPTAPESENDASKNGKIYIFPQFPFLTLASLFFPTNHLFECDKNHL